MGKLKVSTELPAQVSFAEALWYDVRRWPAFVDGFAHVRSTEGEWPHTGARLVWQSVPQGRGLVSERVLRYEVRSGQTVAVEDPRITGEQTVTFEPRAEGGSRITVELSYRMKDGNPLMAVVDVLFVRRAFADATRRTLARFRREVQGDLDLARER